MEEGLRVVLDADGLIKLHRAKVLKVVVEAYNCIVPVEVFEEAVTRGRARRYADADEIDATITGQVQVISSGRGGTRQLGLGSGEMAILTTLRQIADPLVVTDDRRFITVLSVENVPFVTPAEMLVVLAEEALVSPAEGLDALERLRPSIRVTAYLEARSNLNSLQENTQ